MSMTVGSLLGGTIGLPVYPWSPETIENMPEPEREAYLTVLRKTRERLLRKK